jgi:hypothetical protein
MFAQMKAMTHYLVDDRRNMAMYQIAEQEHNPFHGEGESSHD